MTVAVGQTIKLRLDSMSYGPEAVGRVDGQVLFVAGGAPGDEVVVKVTRAQGRLARADIVSIDAASPHRVEPPCRVFGVCGGCQWQHLAYAEQLAQKSRALADTLRRIGGFADIVPLEPIGMAEPWRYRNAAQFVGSPDGLLGFRAFGSDNIVDVEACPIVEPAIDRTLAVLRADPPGALRLEVRVGLDGQIVTSRGARLPRALARRLRREAEAIGVVALPERENRDARRRPLADEEPEVVDTPVQVVSGVNYVELPLLGRRFRVTAGAFFQVNTRPDPRPLPPELGSTAARHGFDGALADRGVSQADALALAMLDALAPAAGQTVVDAYAGVGAYTVILAAIAGRVIAVEQSPIAVADARFNCSFGADNVRIYHATVADGLAGLTEPVDGVVVDPPRAGCGPAVIAELRRLAPQRIAYVACDPATLARDLAALCADNAYRLVWTRVVDLFPHTYHVESVTCLERVAGG